MVSYETKFTFLSSPNNCLKGVQHYDSRPISSPKQKNDSAIEFFNEQRLVATCSVLSLWDNYEKFWFDESFTWK